MDPSASSLTGGCTSSASSHMHKDSSASSKLLDEDKEESGPAQPAATISPFLLPIELLVEIFRCLNTSQVARAAQVCRTWNAATRDARAWRNIGFRHRNGTPPNRELQLMRERCTSICAKSGNTVESVDLDDLSSLAVATLAEELAVSAQTLQHIRWSSSPGDHESACSVIRLARLCPQLETLELRLFNLNLLMDLSFEFSDAAVKQRLGRPRCFRLIVDRSESAAYFGMHRTTFFDNVTTFEVKFADCSSFVHQEELMNAQDLWTLLVFNSVIENVTAHGLHESTSGSVSAPSLRFLDLRFSTPRCSWEPSSLHASNLREIIIDAKLLPALTPASTAMLSLLTLRVVGNSGVPIPGELDVIEKMRRYEGTLRLTVGKAYSEQMLKLLSESFVWPGLEEVEIEIDGTCVHSLIGVMAARQAGSQGASTEQYLEMARVSNTKLHTAKWSHFWDADRVGMNVTDAADALMDAAYAFPQGVGSPPLCSQVRWIVSIQEGSTRKSQIFDWMRKWFDEEPNVTVRA